MTEIQDPNSHAQQTDKDLWSYWTEKLMFEGNTNSALELPKNVRYYILSTKKTQAMYAPFTGKAQYTKDSCVDVPIIQTRKDTKRKKMTPSVTLGQQQQRQI